MRRNLVNVIETEIEYLPHKQIEVSHGSHQFREDIAILSKLKACIARKDLDEGKRLHENIVKKGFVEKNIRIGNSLVSLYAKCGKLQRAQEVFDQLPARDVASWNSLIGGYVLHGQCKRALQYYWQMQHKGFVPDAITYIGALKACGSIRAVDKGGEIHSEIVKAGCLGSNLVGTALVDMYAKCGALSKAQGLFDELQDRNVVSWNALIIGYAHEGCGEKALVCFERMQQEGLTPSVVTLIGILKSCACIRAISKGKEIHAEILRQGLLKKNSSLGNALVDMFAKFGDLKKAEEIFRELPIWDVVTWNVLIAGFVQHEQCTEALDYFEWMRRDGYLPDVVTFVCVLKACGSVRDIDKGRELHVEVAKQGLLHKSILLATTLMDMYTKCGTIGKAQEVFNALTVRDIASWNALIAGYAQQSLGEEALRCYNQMQREGHFPNAVTLLCILKACRSTGLGDHAMKIHAAIVQQRLLKTSIVVGTALVDLYAKCGAMERAKYVFDELQFQNTVSWTTLISGFTQHGYGEEALHYFECMQCEGVVPSEATLVCALKACGIMGARDKGEEIHDFVVKEGILADNTPIGNALLDMYAKCGALTKVLQVFHEIPVHDIISWNSVITGFAQHGHGEVALYYFQKMQDNGIPPNSVTVLLVLSACNHGGLIEVAGLLFRSMTTGYSVIPNIEHYACMVDLFSRAGLFNKAIVMIRSIPNFDYHPMWTALMGSCQKWGNILLGRVAFEHIIELDEEDAAAYVCMGNMYIAAFMKDDADKIEVLRVQNKAMKVLLD